MPIIPTLESKAVGPQARGQPGLHSKTLFKKQKQTTTTKFGEWMPYLVT
jgi:hypothetical protein